MKTTTCQICGRPIKSKNGKIAHHGYRRPGDGFQTASCYGARHLPYEVSRDLIPVVIEDLQVALDTRLAFLNKLINDPPATLGYSEYRGFGQYGDWVVVAKPADFDPKTARNDHRQRSYVFQWFDKKSKNDSQIRAITEQIEYLQARYESWVAPSGEGE